MKMIASFKSVYIQWLKQKKENIVMYGNAISFNIFRYYFFKSNSMHHFWEYLLCRWGNAKKPLKILLLSVRIQTARALLMSFSHTHEKYVARKHGFPILFFKYTVYTTTTCIQVYPLSDFLSCCPCIHYGWDGWCNFLSRLTFANTLQFISYIRLETANAGWCSFASCVLYSNMHPFLVHFRLHVLATVKGILSCN